MRFFTKKSCYYQGFFAVKRRAVFILGAMWIALVRGWRRDCVVGGMETRFQWRKAHSPSAKCEAFHVAPRLFFMFLFLIPFTIRQHCIIHPPANFPLNQKKQPGLLPRLLGKNYSDVGLLQFGECCCDACGGFHNVFIAGGVTHANVAWARECVAAHGCHVRLVEQVH